jgi:hypothetical protein
VTQQKPKQQVFFRTVLDNASGGASIHYPKKIDQSLPEMTPLPKDAAYIDAQPSSPKKTTFYVVSKNKLLVMFWLTLGLYIFYWTYKNWKTYQTATNTTVFPLTRTLLGLFFIHSLLMKIHHQGKKLQKQYKWSPRLLASGLMLAFTLTIYSSLLPYSIGAQYLFPLIAKALCFYCLIQVQSAINHVENDPEGHQNANITIPNCIWISSLGFGLLLWVIIIFYFSWWYIPLMFSLARWMFL